MRQARTSPPPTTVIVLEELMVNDMSQPLVDVHRADTLVICAPHVATDKSILIALSRIYILETSNISAVEFSVHKLPGLTAFPVSVRGIIPGVRCQGDINVAV